MGHDLFKVARRFATKRPKGSRDHLAGDRGATVLSFPKAGSPEPVRSGCVLRSPEEERFLMGPFKRKIRRTVMRRNGLTVRVLAFAPYDRGYLWEEDVRDVLMKACAFSKHFF